uniref:Histone-lysine N-methyltransferase Su(Var)3-9 n=1 Tax=Cacopsylla melanoneura TaxID=428564 RepID=A0A8D8YCU2_9HEMI
MSDDDVILLSSDDSSPVSPAVQTESNDVEILTPLVKQEVSEAKLELKPDKAALEAFLRELSELPGSSQDSDTDNNDEPPSKLSHNEKSPSKSKPISLSQETNANEITPRNSQVQSPISSTFGSKTPEGSVSGEHKTSMACLNSPPIYNFERKSQKRVYPMSPIASPRKPMGKSCSQNLMERVEKEKYIAVNSAKSSQSPAQTCDFEVEKILDQIELGPERFLYKVKWVGFDETDCTWEPLENLTNCLQLVHEFKMKLMKIPTNPVERRFQQLRKYMMQHTETDLELFTQRFRSDKGELSIPKIDLNEVYGFIRNFARHPHLIETNKAELNYLREQLLTSLLYEKRLVQIENLKRYEMEINVTTGNAVAPIYVINNVDLEVVPANFTHTNHNIPTEGVVVTEEPIIWCECPDNCKGKARNIQNIQWVWLGRANTRSNTEGNVRDRVCGRDTHVPSGVTA